MERRLNLGCGFMKLDGWVNVDKYDNCKPDVVYDLNKIPWPWEDNWFYEIKATHFFEHLNRETWFEVFKECARVMAVGGELEIHVPDASNDQSITYRDHWIIFDKNTFHGIQNWHCGNSAWAHDEAYRVPLKMMDWLRVPFQQYLWMRHFPWLFRFCAKHMRNFVWEQVFIFQKINLEGKAK